MLSRSLYKKEIQENMMKFLFGILLLSIIAFVTAWANFDSHLFQDVLPGFTEAGRVELEERLQEHYEALLWDQWNVKRLTFIGTLVAILLGAGVFAQEKAKGTLFFLTSIPLSRNNIYDTKIAAGLTLLGICIMGSTLLLFLFTSLAGLFLPAFSFLAGALLAFCGLAVTYQVTVIFSLITNDPIKAGAGSALLYFLLSIPGWFEGTEKFSLLFQMQSRKSVLEEPFSWFFFLLMALIFLILRHLGQWLWSREEI